MKHKMSRELRLRLVEQLVCRQDRLNAMATRGSLPDRNCDEPDLEARRSAASSAGIAKRQQTNGAGAGVRMKHELLWVGFEALGRSQLSKFSWDRC